MKKLNLAHIVPDAANCHGLHGYKEIIESIEWGARKLGYEVTYRLNELDGSARNVVFGFQMLAEADLRRLPRDTICYNLEQLYGRDIASLSPNFRYAAENLTVWDYSEHNLATWQQLWATDNVSLLPIAYAPTLSRIRKVPQDIDVLFYGLPGDRRLKIFNSICLEGLKCVFLSGLYGKARDDLIARSKVVLNINQYHHSKIFEVARVSYLLANHKAVVSDLAEETKISPEYLDALRFVQDDVQFPRACLELVADSKQREAVAEKGFAAFAKKDIRPLLQAALEH